MLFSSTSQVQGSAPRFALGLGLAVLPFHRDVSGRLTLAAH